MSQLKIQLSENRLRYYTSIEYIPIYNWYQIELGKFEYLFKNKKGKVPAFFSQIIEDMFYQFEIVDMTAIAKRHKLAYLMSLFVTSGRIDFLNKARHLKAEIERDSQKIVKNSTLNERVNFIEASFNSIGSIDVKKMSASRFYSLYHMAIKKAEKLENANNKER